MSIWLKTARKNRLAEITKALSLELEHVGDRDWLDSVSIFGSWAKDSFTGQSDLDLLVLTKHEPTNMGELERIGFKLDLPVDLVVLTKQEYEEKLAQGNPFFQEIEATRHQIWPPMVLTLDYTENR